MAVDFYMNQVIRMKDSQDRFKNGNIVDAYKMLNNMHDCLVYGLGIGGGQAALMPVDFRVERGQGKRVVRIEIGEKTLDGPIGGRHFGPVMEPE